jgi:DNA-binding LacI/PurR family transcriptional regulator
MAVTAADVARRAGVSTATVSFVLNRDPRQKISEATQESVRRAAEELGYRPNAAARVLRTGRGNAVLLPLPGLQPSHVHGQLIQHCSRELAEHDLSLVTDYTDYPTPDHAVRAWSRLNVAAVLDVVLPHDSPLAAALVESGVPVVAPPLDGELPWESHGDTFFYERRLIQLRYLIERGHRRVTFALPRFTDPRVEQRMFRKLRGLGARQGTTVKLRRLKLTAASVTEFVQEWAAAPEADAIACLDDDFAMAVVAAFTHRGISVPGDVAVMGVDDVPLSAAFMPGITTIAADFAPFARALAGSAVDAMAGDRHPAPIPMPQHRVVQRESA